VVAAATSDDAAVYRLSDDRAVVATVDFFAPIVDDAYAFGAIAAANAFSDVYAMGARPLFALNLVAWPRDPAMLDLLGDTLRGGADTAARAGAFVVGGHSIDDPEPKYGMVVLGEARPDKVITNAGARPGDVLVLTKPIGTGILSTALKRELVREADLTDAVQSMMALNADALDAVEETGSAVHAMTDVTGFGLLGHLHNMLSASRVGARLAWGRVPLLARATELAAQGVVPGGTHRNLEAAERFTRFAPALDATTRLVLADAQTSGGLLIAAARDHADHLVTALRKRDTPAARVIGETVGGNPTIEVVP
jgi:selenide,water dikinase